MPLWLFVSGDVPDPSRDDGAREDPTIIANPPGDSAFRALIDRFLIAGGRDPVDLQATLRRRYPLAVVRPRSLADERFEVWYAYRDGRWIGEGSHAEA